jgi:hypothetical protein
LSRSFEFLIRTKHFSFISGPDFDLDPHPNSAKRPDLDSHVERFGNRAKRLHFALLAELWIWTQHFKWSGNGSGNGSGSGSNPDPGFWWPKTEEYITAEIFFLPFFYQKLQFTYVQVTGEAFSPQKRTSSASKMKFINFSMVVERFCPPGSGSGMKIRIQIQGSHWIRIQSGYGSGSTALLNS